MPRIVFPWLVPNDPASLASFAANAAHVTHVRPTWYAIDARGEVASRRDDRVLEVARAAGVPVHPLIVNERFQPDVAHALLATPETRRRAAETIARLIVDEP